MIVSTIEEMEEELIDIIGYSFSVSLDKNGQIVIHTGLCESQNGELEKFLDDEEIEEDSDLDPDVSSLDEEIDDE